MHNLTLQYMYIMLKSVIIQNSFVSTVMAYSQNISDCSLPGNSKRKIKTTLVLQ